MNAKNSMLPVALMSISLITNAADNEDKIKVVYYKNTLSAQEETAVVSSMQEEPGDSIDIKSLKNHWWIQISSNARIFTNCGQ